MKYDKADLQRMNIEELKSMLLELQKEFLEVKKEFAAKEFEIRKKAHFERQANLLALFKTKYALECHEFAGTYESINWEKVTENIQNYDVATQEGWALGYDARGRACYGVSYYGGGAGSILVENEAEALREIEREKIIQDHKNKT